MIMPTIHLNGTSRGELLEQVIKARLALHYAIIALHCTAPHSRDYYPQGSEAFNVAIREYANRCDKLNEVARDLAQLAEHITDAE